MLGTWVPVTGKLAVARAFLARADDLGPDGLGGGVHLLAEVAAARGFEPDLTEQSVGSVTRTGISTVLPAGTSMPVARKKVGVVGRARTWCHAPWSYASTRMRLLGPSRGTARSRGGRIFAFGLTRLSLRGRRPHSVARFRGRRRERGGASVSASAAVTAGSWIPSAIAGVRRGGAAASPRRAELTDAQGRMGLPPTHTAEAVPERGAASSGSVRLPSRCLVPARLPHRPNR